MDQTGAGRAAGFLRVLVLAIGWLNLLVGIAAVVLYVVPSLHVRDARLAMAASFIPYGVLAWLAATLVFALAARRRARLLALVALTGLILQVVWARPYWRGPSPASNSSAVTVLSLNMRCDGEGLEDLATQIRRFQPDVLVLQGADGVTREFLADEGWPGAAQDVEYAPLEVDPTCGKVVISDFEVSDHTQPGDVRPVFRIDLPTGPLTLIPVDAPTPLEGTERWGEAIASVQRTAENHATEPLLLIGDFNAVREHLPMRRLLATGLNDAAEQSQAGWMPTFPAHAVHPPVIAIDHALTSPDLQAVGLETFSVEKNAHLGLVVHLAPR